MKNRTVKSLFALLLTALLALSLLSLTVLADETEVPAGDPADAVVTVNADEAEDTDKAVIGGADEPTDIVVEETENRITLNRLPANLARMGIGMACIIAVMGVLIIVTVILNKVTAPKEK